jgi:hypothetical protein
VEVFWLIAMWVGGASIIGWCLDYYFIGQYRPKKKPVEPLEPLPAVKWQDIEEVAKATPEYKAWKEKHDKKYSAQRSERNKWGTDFLALKKELKRKHCKHVYDYGSNWRWYVCTECDYEDTPYYTFECDCSWEEDSSYYHHRQVLTRRNPLCRVHGRDIQKYQEQRYEFHKNELFAKGGITPKEY